MLFCVGFLVYVVTFAVALCTSVYVWFVVGYWFALLLLFLILCINNAMFYFSCCVGLMLCITMFCLCFGVASFLLQ